MRSTFFAAAAVAVCCASTAAAQEVPRAPAPVRSPVSPPPVAQPEPLPPPPVAASPLRGRGSWYIGFGLGGGVPSVQIGDRRYDARELLGRGATAVALNFRVGATVTPKLLVGLDTGANAGTASSPTESLQLNYYDVGAMYFPWERGLFLRGAAGLSSVVLRSDGPIFSGSGRYGGWNVLGGLGYALWLGKAFNLTANVDYQVHRFSSSGDVDVKGGRGWSAWLGFDWY